MPSRERQAEILHTQINECCKKIDKEFAKKRKLLDKFNELLKDHPEVSKPEYEMYKYVDPKDPSARFRLMDL